MIHLNFCGTIEECDGWVHITFTELEYSNLSDSAIYSCPDSTVFTLLLYKITLDIIQ